MKIMRFFGMILLVAMFVFSNIEIFAQERPASFTLPQGQTLVVRLGTPLGSRTSKVNEQVELFTAQLIPITDKLALPGGLTIVGKVTKVDRAGRIHGKAEIVVTVEKIFFSETFALPISIGQVVPLSQIAAGPWYRPLGKLPYAASEGNIVFAGRSTTADDLQEVARGTFVFGGLTTLLKRGLDLEVDAGMPFTIVLGKDLVIPTDRIPLVETGPLCPCEEGKGGA